MIERPPIGTWTGRARLTDAGWSALRAHGIRTVVDPRNHDGRQAVAERRPAGITSLHVPLDDRADTGFWGWGHLVGPRLT